MNLRLSPRQQAARGESIRRAVQQVGPLTAAQVNAYVAVRRAQMARSSIDE